MALPVVLEILLKGMSSEPLTQLFCNVLDSCVVVSIGMT